MASNKKRIGLDQPNGDALTGIDRALAALAGEEIKSDEFTLAMICNRDPSYSYDEARHKLDRLVRSGTCAKRIVRIKGRATNAYRYI